MRNRSAWLILPLTLAAALSGCRGDGPAANGAAAAPDAPVQMASLTGLYESGEGPRRNQLCLIERDGGRTSFGLISWGSENRNCSGVGQATRDGDRLRLAMAGDDSCIIEARIDGGRVVLPDTMPQGCAYYCAGDARLAGAAFDKTGGTEQDAIRATDLVGDPLCGR